MFTVEVKNSRKLSNNFSVMADLLPSSFVAARASYHPAMPPGGSDDRGIRMGVPSGAAK